MIFISHTLLSFNTELAVWLDEKKNLKVERKHSMSVHKPNFSEFQNIRKNIKSSEVEIYGSLMPGAYQFITQAYPCPVHILLVFVTLWNASVPSHRIHFTHNCCSISGTQSVKQNVCVFIYMIIHRISLRPWTTLMAYEKDVVHKICKAYIIAGALAQHSR